MSPGFPARPWAEVLEERTERRGPDECWPWLGGHDRRTGYPYLNVAGRGIVGAHRLALELDIGEPVPRELDVHHRCGNRGCVNPRHLEALSRARHQQIHAQIHAQAAVNARWANP